MTTYSVRQAPISKAGTVEWGSYADVASIPDIYEDGDEVILANQNGFISKRINGAWVTQRSRSRVYPDESARLSRTGFTPDPDEIFRVSGGFAYTADATTPAIAAKDDPITSASLLLDTQIQDRSDEINTGLVSGKSLADREATLQGTVTQAVTGTEETATFWAPKTLKEVVTALKTHDAATLYVETSGYAIDDIVSYDGIQADSGIYKALEAIAEPAGVFDPAKWSFIGTPREYVVVDSPTDLSFNVPFFPVVVAADWVRIENGTADFERLSTDFINRIEGSLDVTDGAIAYTIPISLGEGEAIYFTAETDGNPEQGNFDNLQIAPTTDGEALPAGLLFDNRWHRIGKIRVRGGQLEIAHTEIVPGVSFNPNDGIDSDISVVLRAAAKVTTVAGLWGSNVAPTVAPVALAQFDPVNADHALASDISAKTIVDYLSNQNDSGMVYSTTAEYAVDDVVSYIGPLADNGVYSANEIIAAPAGAFDSAKWTRIGSAAAATNTVTARFQPNFDYTAGDPIIEPNPLDNFEPYIWTVDDDFTSSADPDFDGTGFTPQEKSNTAIGIETDIINDNGEPKTFAGRSISKAIDIIKDQDLITRVFRPALATQLYGLGGGKVRVAIDPTNGLPYAVSEGLTAVTSDALPSQNGAEWQLLFADDLATDPMRVLLGQATATQGGGVITFNDTFANIKAKYFKVEAYMVSDGFDVPTSRHHLSGGSFLTAFIEDGLPMRVEGSGRISSFTSNDNGAGPMSVTNSSVSAGPQAIKFYGVKDQFRGIGVNEYQVDDTPAPAPGTLAGFVDDGAGGNKLSPIAIPSAAQFEVFTGTDETPKLHSPKLLKDDIEFVTARRHLLEHNDETKNLFGTDPAYQKYAFKNGKVFEALVGVADPNSDPDETSVALQPLKEANWRQVSGVIYLNTNTIAVPNSDPFEVVNDLPVMLPGDTVDVTIKIGTIFSTMSFTYKSSGDSHKIHINTHEWGIGILDRALSLDVVTGGGTQSIESIKITR